MRESYPIQQRLRVCVAFMCGVAKRCNKKYVVARACRCEWRSKITLKIKPSPPYASCCSLLRRIPASRRVRAHTRTTGSAQPSDKPHERGELHSLNGYAQMPELGIPEKKGWRKLGITFRSRDIGLGVGKLKGVRLALEASH